MNQKETYLRLERLGEYFTYLTVLVGVVIIQFPFPFDINKNAVVVIAFATALFSLIWHRFTPKDFSGKNKNFIEAVVDVFAISLVVHFSSGINGYFIFLYFLPILNVAANLERSSTFTIVLITYALLLIEGLEEVSTTGIGALSITVFYMWTVGVVAAYGRLLAHEVALAKKKEEEVKVEQIEEVSKLKDEFVFIISHELRSPITAIRGYLELLLTDKGEALERIRPFLSKAFYTANKLANLVSLLLEVSRLETGRIKFYLQKTNLAQSVSDTLKGISTDAQARNVKIKIKVPEDYSVVTDPERLIEILTILIENAVRYTPEGNEVEIKAERNLRFLKLSVKDNGEGIEPELKKHLFEKFYSSKIKLKDNSKKMGISMYVVDHLMKAMHGEVLVDSKAGKGTIFTLVFPLTVY